MLKTQYGNLLKKLSKEHIETCESHKLYSKGDAILIDISPGDELQCFNKKHDARINTIWQLFKSYFDDLQLHTEELEVSMEISKTGRMHFHTNMIVLNGAYIASIIGQITHKYQVRVEVDSIKDMDYRRAYIRKDFENNLRFLRYFPDPDDDYSDSDSSESSCESRDTTPDEATLNPS